MSLHVCVILFTGGGLPQCMMGYHHPPGKADPPCAVHAGRYGQQGGGMHPTGMQLLFSLIFVTVAVSVM